MLGLPPFPFPLDLSPISENTGNIDLPFAKWETGELRGFDDRKVLKVLLALAYHASAAYNNTSGEIVCKENFFFLLKIVFCKQWILAWKTGSQGGFLLWSLINCEEATLKTVRTSQTSQWYCPGFCPRCVYHWEQGQLDSHESKPIIGFPALWTLGGSLIIGWMHI